MIAKVNQGGLRAAKENQGTSARKCDVDARADEKGQIMGNQVESTNHEQAISENDKSLNPFEKYRMDVYGNARSDFEVVEVALFCQISKLAVACKAVEAIKNDLNDDDSMCVLLGVHDMLSEVMQTMNETLSLLDECELKRG